MIFAHSFSLIEQNIFRHLQTKLNISQIDVKVISDVNDVDSKFQFSSHSCLIYSFLQLDDYKYIDTFKRECQVVDHLIAGAIKNKFSKIVVLTYPGAFINSDNLYLQHKGIIEKKFIDSGIPITYLHVQAIVNPYQKVNSLHSLFYNPIENNYVIPQKSNLIIYSVTVNNIVDIIISSCLHSHEGHFDVFDQVTDLISFLKIYSPHIAICKIFPTYLLIKSYLGQYISPTMLELFLRTSVPMYSYRTEQAFNIPLNAQKPIEKGYHQNQDYKVSPVFGTKGFSLSS